MKRQWTDEERQEIHARARSAIWVLAVIAGAFLLIGLNELATKLGLQ